MMSSLQAAIKRLSARVLRYGMSESLESGGLLLVDVGTVREFVRVAVGRIKVVRVFGMDFEM